MARLTPVVRWQVTAGQPVVVGTTRITVQSWSLVVGWLALGVIWRHPTAALVEVDGRAARLPIHDVSRLIEVGLLGLGFAIVIVMASMRRKEHVSIDIARPLHLAATTAIPREPKV
jgi:hypothetical protein